MLHRLGTATGAAIVITGSLLLLMTLLIRDGETAPLDDARQRLNLNRVVVEKPPVVDKTPRMKPPARPTPPRAPTPAMSVQAVFEPAPPMERVAFEFAPAITETRGVHINHRLVADRRPRGERRRFRFEIDKQ